MSCKKCRHWFVNPNIVVSGEPTEGKCLVSEIKTQSNHVCNAWERSEVFRENGFTAYVVEICEKLIEFLRKSNFSEVLKDEIDRLDQSVQEVKDQLKEVTE